MNLTDEQKHLIVGAIVGAVLLLVGQIAHILGASSPTVVVAPAATSAPVNVEAISLNGGIQCKSSPQPCIESLFGRGFNYYSDGGAITATARFTGGNLALSGNFAPLLSSSIQVTNTIGRYSLLNSVARTDTANKVVGMLPANAVLLDIQLHYGTASNAGTTATVSCGKTSGTPTEYINAADVKTAAVLVRAGSGATMPYAGLGAVGTADSPVYCKYAETGGASATGGPFTVTLTYGR